MAVSPSAVTSTAYDCSRRPLASTLAACGSSSTRSKRMTSPGNHTGRKMNAHQRVHLRFIIRALHWRWIRIAKGEVMRKTVAIVAWMACAAFAVQAQDGPYKLIKEIKVGGDG